MHGDCVIWTPPLSHKTLHSLRVWWSHLYCTTKLTQTTTNYSANGSRDSSSAVVVVFFFQYNQSWTSLPSIMLSRIRYAVCGAWSFGDYWTVTPVHLQLLVPLTLVSWLQLAELPVSICFVTVRAETQMLVVGPRIDTGNAPGPIPSASLNRQS